MAPVNDAWNQAYDRLWDYLSAFALDDHEHMARLTLAILDRAKKLHAENPSIDPVTLTMTEAEKQLEEWLADSLKMQGEPASRVFASGGTALLLSRDWRSAPESFLAPSPPENLSESMRETLLVTGPDLKMSSMTPRALDYGPMLGLAKQTWHRWNGREIVLAMVFWAGVYFVLYWWFSGTL